MVYKTGPSIFDQQDIVAYPSSYLKFKQSNWKSFTFSEFSKCVLCTFGSGILWNFHGICFTLSRRRPTLIPGDSRLAPRVSRCREELHCGRGGRHLSGGQPCQFRLPDARNATESLLRESKADQTKAITIQIHPLGNLYITNRTITIYKYL